MTLSDLHTRAEFKQRYQEVYPDNSKQGAPSMLGQVYRFTREIKEGDYVLTYIKSSRELLIGRITGGYAYRPGALEGTYDQVRPVAWEGRFSRDDFSTGARNSMGSTLTVFSLTDHLKEIIRVLAGEPPAETKRRKTQRRRHRSTTR